jgi:hypothetical protein
MDIRSFIWATGLTATLAAAITTPLLDERVTLRADFTAAAGQGSATFQGVVALEGSRSAWDALRFGPIDHPLASRALERAVSGALGHVQEPLPAGQTQAWGRQLEAACSEALAREAGGQWRGALAPGFSVQRD